MPGVYLLGHPGTREPEEKSQKEGKEDGCKWARADHGDAAEQERGLKNEWEMKHGPGSQCLARWAS